MKTPTSRMLGTLPLVLAVAMVCHEANRSFCRTLGDNSQPAWDDAPEWQKESAIKGVEFHLANPDASASASHDSWLKEKQETGWKYGPVKDPEKKEHPCFVPFEQLPIEQQLKDHLFKAVVHALNPDTENVYGSGEVPDFVKQAVMRAKLQISSVVPNNDPDGQLNNEQVHFHGVCASRYPEDGSDENNTFAKFSPSVSLDITIANPALLGKFTVGQQFYVDFTPVAADVIIVEEVETSKVPNFRDACNFLRADILTVDKQVIALKEHPGKGTEQVGEVIANLVLSHRHLEDARMRLGKAIQYSEDRESIFDVQKDPEKLGKLAHQRFAEARGAKEDWDSLPDEIKQAWIAAGSAGVPVAS